MHTIPKHPYQRHHFPLRETTKHIFTQNWEAIDLQCLPWHCNLIQLYSTSSKTHFKYLSSLWILVKNSLQVDVKRRQFLPKIICIVIKQQNIESIKAGYIRKPVSDMHTSVSLNQTNQERLKVNWNKLIYIEHLTFIGYAHEMINI